MYRFLLVIFMSFVVCLDASSEDAGGKLHGPAGARRVSDNTNTDKLTPAFKDHIGINRDIYYFFAYQVGAVGLLYVSPESISEWDEEQKKNWGIERYIKNIGDIVWDKDALLINYVMHPYWGGAYYVRARNRGFNHKESFWYAALFSTLFEYGVEAMFEKPSIQDLIVTPVAGTYVGQYFMSVRERIIRREKNNEQPGSLDGFLMVMTDPLGALNEKVDKAFGRKMRAELRFTLMSPVSLAQMTHWKQSQLDNNRAVNHFRPAMGLQLDIIW